MPAVSSGTQRSEFTYNGLSQRVKIVEKTNGAVTSTKQFVWCPGDPQPYEQRDGSNNVTKRFYPQGEQIGGTNYYCARDHLGSIRELTDSSGAVQARYDYDPYGRRTKLSGNVDADFVFTGHYYHQLSGLHLALSRAYDAGLGRWISRDPIGEKGGINLYGYVFNNPISLVDPLGLLVDAYLNEAQGIVTVIDRDTGQVAAFTGGSGLNGTSYWNNWTKEGESNAGPLPRGDYDILNRIQGGNPALDGVPAWALDLEDSHPLDDVARGYGRGAFRFHFGDSTGCITTHDPKGFGEAVDILNHTKTLTVTDANGASRTYYGNFHVFSGEDTARAVLP